MPVPSRSVVVVAATKLSAVSGSSRPVSPRPGKRPVSAYGYLLSYSSNITTCSATHNDSRPRSSSVGPRTCANSDDALRVPTGTNAPTFMSSTYGFVDAATEIGDGRERDSFGFARMIGIAARCGPRSAEDREHHVAVRFRDDPGIVCPPHDVAGLVGDRRAWRQAGREPVVDLLVGQQCVQLRRRGGTVGPEQRAVAGLREEEGDVVRAGLLRARQVGGAVAVAVQPGVDRSVADEVQSRDPTRVVRYDDHRPQALVDGPTFPVV